MTAPTHSTISRGALAGRSALSAIRAFGFAAALAVGLAAAGSSLADPDSDAAMKAFNTHQYPQAIDLATKSIATKESIEALYIRGNAYAATGKFPQAITDLQKAKALAVAGGGGGITNAIDNSLITSFMFSGQTDQAMVVYHDVKKRAPNDSRIDDTAVQGFMAQANANLRANKIPEAVTILERGATEMPNRAGTFYATAAYYMSGDPKADWKKVQLEAEKSLAIDPNNARANYEAGLALANQGDKAGALVRMQKAKTVVGSDAALGKEVDDGLVTLQTPDPTPAPPPAPTPKG